jgi:prepilin-type processing-associated H-X9-DG protein
MGMRLSATVSLLALAVLLSVGNLPGQEKTTAAKGRPWTLDEALAQLKLYPKDSYLQYVALQLARREKREQRVVAEITALQPALFGPRTERARDVDLFSIFTGALAVQESLQLDTMRGERPREPAFEPPNPMPANQQQEAQRKQAAEKRRKVTVSVNQLTGPTVKSHPWKKMLGSRKPDISSLARWVPEDFFFAEFRSLNKLIEALEVSDLWGTHLFNQATQEARNSAVGERLKLQLAVETNRLLRPLYDTVVGEAAVTGSDLFFREGSDVTLLFRIKQPDLFKARMDGFLAHAEKTRHAKRVTGEYLGVPYVHVATPDRTVHVFSAYPSADLHVRSNSRVGLERVLEAIQGKRPNGSAVRRLGDSDEFAYIRTLMPRGAKEEDGLVYLSDPFIRRLVGPQVKLTERRRMLCYNDLRMIGHAALLFRTEHGRAPASLAELEQAQCSPGKFGQGNLACPDGGTYRLSDDGMTGVCSHHGPANSLTPCCESPVTEVNGEEADEYKAFLEEYNRYWRMYFDPIALRLQMTPERYRLETIVLPLIDNSIYTGMANALGGKPEPLDGLPAPKRNIFSVAVRVQKPEAQTNSKGGAAPVACMNNMKQILLAMHNYHDVYGRLPAIANFNKEGKPLLSWRVHLLPYLEQEALYKEFHLDEPWDSPHNKELVRHIPSIYRCPDQRPLSLETSYQVPIGQATMFSGGPKGLRIPADVPDGTSNTIMLVETDDDHAVPWTKPNDWKYDPDKPAAGLGRRHPGGLVIGFADGHSAFLREGNSPKFWQALFTRAGGELVAVQPDDEIGQASLPDFFNWRWLRDEDLEKLKVMEFVYKGLGNQAGLHLYDSVPLFDFNLPSFLGMALGSFNGRMAFTGNSEIAFGFVIASLTSPVYASFPVQDKKIVDDFLRRLDDFVARSSKERDRTFFGPLERDFYRFPLDKEKKIRCYAIQFGPIRWRLFWGRIGNGLYIANKPFIFEDLLALDAAQVPAGKPSLGEDVGHAMVRIRAQNWNQVLADYRLGWAENERTACLANLGPLASLTRAYGSVFAAGQLAERFYGVHFFCPDHGTYSAANDGTAIVCSVHGSALAPHQPRAPSEQSSTSQLLRGFTGMTVTLTFRDEGLHAVVNVDRK